MFILEAVEAGWGLVSGGVSDLVAKAKAAVRSVLIFASTVFGLVGGAWDWMVNGIGWLGNNLIGALARLLHLLEWLALHAIPEGLQWVLGRATHLAAVALHSARSFLEGLVHSIGHWALHELTRLWRFATGELKRAWHTIATVWNFIEHTARRAVDLVEHPDKLVHWILASLVLPLIRFLLEASAPLLVILFKAFKREAVAFAHTLEDVLAKVI